MRLAGTFLLFFAAILSFVPAVNAAESLPQTPPLRSYAAKGAEIAVEADIAKLLQMDFIRENPALLETVTNFEKESGINSADVRDILWVGTLSSKAMRALLLHSSRGEAELAAAAKTAPKQIAGRNIYEFRTDTSVEELNRTIKLTFLAPDTVLASEDGYFEKYLSALQNGREEALFFVNSDAPLRLYMRPESGKGNDAVQALLKGVSLLFGSVRPEQGNGGIVINLIAQCKNSKSARKVAMQSNMMLMMLLGGFFGEDQNLAQDVMSGIRISADNDRATAEMGVSPELAKRIQSYAAQRIE